MNDTPVGCYSAQSGVVDGRAMDNLHQNYRTYLKMLQNIIERFAWYSLCIKGFTWLLLGVFSFRPALHTNKAIVCLSFIPVIFFWIWDSFMLFQERLYRVLFNNVASKDCSDIDMFRMFPYAPDRSKKTTWIQAMLSWSEICFYFCILLTLLLVIIGKVN